MDPLKVIQATVEHSTTKDVRIIARAIHKSSKKYNIDWRIITAIIQQESTFQKDPQECLTSKKHCADLGIGQINWHTWATPLSLNRKRLLTDINYNIDVMGHILSIVKKGHEKDTRWFSRYHSFKPSTRRVYESFVTPKFKRIKIYAQQNYYK